MFSQSSSSSASSSSLANLDVELANRLALSEPTRLAKVDLHGFSVEEAKNQITSIIKNASAYGWNEIRIITGRGNHVTKDGESGKIYKGFPEWIKEVSENLSEVQKFDGYYEVKMKDNLPLRNPLEACLNKGVEAFLTQNFKTIEQKAKGKDYEALEALAICYDNGYGIKRDYKKAAELYLQLMETANPDAMYAHELGHRYLFGKGVMLNELTAIKFFTIAADKGYVLAEFAVGSMYWNGTGLPKPDYILGVKYLTLAAKHGYVEAMRILGFAYRDGLGVTKDINEAIQLWQAAEKLGDAVAALNLFFLYEDGKLVGKNPTAALLYLESAAKLGHSSALYLLGIKYFFGISLLSNKAQGLALIEQAAKNGKNDAQYFLFLYFTHLGEDDKARNYLKAAAENHHIEAQVIAICHSEYFDKSFEEKVKIKLLTQTDESILELVDIYRSVVLNLLLQHDGTKKQVKKGIAILLKLASTDPVFYAQLARIYQRGLGSHIKPNPSAAYGYAKQGADKSDAKCLCLLGDYWIKGIGGKKDLKKALKSYSAAAAKQDASAHYALGIIHLEGLSGMPINMPLAIEHFTQAMQLDKADLFVRSAETLADIYFKGKNNIPKNLSQALNYYADAAENGSGHAATILFQHYCDVKQYDKAWFYHNLAAKTKSEKTPWAEIMEEHFPEYIEEYNLADKIKIDDLKGVTLLKQKSHLPFFTLRDKKTNQVDAVVECTTQAINSAVEKLDSDDKSLLKHYGCFFYYGKQKTRLYVLHDINVVHVPITKYVGQRNA